MSRSWSKGSTSAWRRTRALILANNRATNGGRCTAAIEGVCTGTADQAHHTKGRAVTGDDPRYLAAVCGACNRKIGDPTRRSSSPEPRPHSKW